jgi:hypothetical protein
MLAIACLSCARACVSERAGETISAKIWSLHLSRIKPLCDIKSKIWILEYYFGGTRVSCTSRSEGRWAPLEMPALCWGVLEVTRACSWHLSQAHLSRSQKISFASILGLFSSATAQGDQHRRKRWGTGKKAASAGILFLQEQIKEIIIISSSTTAQRTSRAFRTAVSAPPRSLLLLPASVPHSGPAAALAERQLRRERRNHRSSAETMKGGASARCCGPSRTAASLSARSRAYSWSPPFFA